MSVEPVFSVFYLQIYASDGIELHITHRVLAHLHLLSLQKLAQNSETGWQKPQSATAKFFPQCLIKTHPIPRFYLRNW